MKVEWVTLSRKEQDRVEVLNLVERGGLVGRDAGALMGLSVRQVRRLLAGYRREGVAALAHGNRGRGEGEGAGGGPPLPSDRAADPAGGRREEPTATAAAQAPAAP